MPSLSHSSSSSSRQSHRSSKHASTSSAADKPKDRDPKRASIPSHSRSKSKSANISVFASPRESGAAPAEYAALLSPSLPLSPTTINAATSATNRVKRPGLTSRAFSAPLVAQVLASTEHELDNGRSNSTSAPGQAYSGGEEEIADDPFFQRYSLAHGGFADEPEQSYRIDSVLMSASTTSSFPLQASDTNSTPLTPLSPQSPRYWNSSQASKPQLQEINIAVVGAGKVGKSTFIKHALDLEDMPASSFTSRKVQMDGTVYVVRLIEVSYGDLDLDEEKCICWPDVVENTPVPHIDGAFTLYDITCKDSLLQVPETLSGLYNARLPFLLVACKCEEAPGTSPVDPDQVDASARAHIGSVRTLRTSQTLKDSQKRCVAVLLRAIAAVRAQQLSSTPNRRRATSNVGQTLESHVPTSLKHNRANSEMSMSMYKGQSQTKPKYRPEQGQNLDVRSQHHGPMAANGSDKSHAAAKRSPIPAGEFEEGLAMRTRPSKHSTTLTGESFEALVGRLLSTPRQKADTQFTDIFLALYRLFASPGQLLDTILRSFEVLSANSLPQMIKVHAQNRHLTVLDLWTSNYPGDFAHQYSHRKLQKFVAKISDVPAFASAAKELSANLDAMVEDDDTDWALCDKDRANVPSMVPLRLNTNGLTDSSNDHDETPVSPVSLGLPHASSTQSLLSFVENATRQAVYLVPQPRLCLTKREWHILMDQPEDIIAKEMTRMDWTMFCSIRPRDLVRHVTLNESGRGQCRSLENVQRMIDHFNHIALWTVNFILLRDKPKHRSFMLEKMMKIARKLREMNNYNSLGAVVAGINNSAVQRLHLTKELIDPAVGKDFLKLDILMGSQKSHSAYRLAWENTPGERIPYLPLHRRDLVTAADGNRTFIGGAESDAQIAQRVDYRERRINWKKFEIMGNVVVGVQKAKEVAYPSLTRNDEIKSLLIDLDMINDEDRLYERSKQLEPGAGDVNNRRFAWRKG